MLQKGNLHDLFIFISCCQGLLIPDCSVTLGRERGESQNANFHMLDALENQQFCCLYPLPNPKLYFQKQGLREAISCTSAQWLA